VYHRHVTTALVLSAGGMFAAWEVGVWKALQHRFQPGMIVGASAGAWNGWAIAGGCTAEELMESWMDPATGTILRFGLHRAGILLPEALHEKARELFARYQPRIPFGLTVVEVPRLRPRLVRDSEIAWQYLAATCSIPFCFPPVRIAGRAYVDGGLLGALPLWAAAEMGATRAIAVNALTSPWYRALHGALRPLVPRAEIEEVRIEPSEPLGSLRDAVAWSRANVERWIEQGERDANRACTSITM
jgi:NTE family protein